MECTLDVRFTRLKGAQRNWQPLFDQLSATTLPALAGDGVNRGARGRACSESVRTN